MATPGTPLAPISEFGPDSGGRIKGITIIKPIIVGNIAKYFGKKREEDGHTHSWTVYVKPFLNEDYTPFIKKVHFKLHDSYANPNRILTEPPYEVSETGWGEFEVVIRIHFNDPIERPVTCYHILKLFSPGHDPTQPGAPAVLKKIVRSESFDEIIFHEPTLLMKSLLDQVRQLPGRVDHDTDFEAAKRTSMDQINRARSKVKDEIQELKAKLQLARATTEQFKAKLNEPTSPKKTGGHPPLTPGTPVSLQKAALTLK